MAESHGSAQEIIARIGDPSGDALLNPDKPRDNVTVGERVFLTSDGRAVTGDDPEAFLLLAPEGGLLPRGLAEELGLTGTTPAANNTAPEALDKLKKAELVAIAQDQGIDGAESMKKAELVSALTETGINLSEVAPTTDTPAPVPTTEPASPPATETPENQGA